MKDWKIIAISGALAFLISFISGLIGQVSLGVLVIRAFFGAIIFGALGYGIKVLLTKYLPEIFELNSMEASEINDDLSVIKEKPGKGSETDPVVKQNSFVDISIGDETETPLNEEYHLDENSNLSGESENENTDLIDEIAETGNLEESTGEDKVPGNLDVLPDMGVFSNSFENTEDIDGSNSNSYGNVTLDIMGDEQDPELVARAVRTMVKKDQEG